MSDTNKITGLLQAVQSGNEAARDDLIQAVYGHLRRLARSRMSQERPGHTLEPTALVHEAYLRLEKHLGDGWEGRAHFFSAVAESMRRILIDYARRRNSEKRGGGESPLPLLDLDVATERSGSWDDLDEALDDLEQRDSRGCTVVKLRYFAGLSVEEIAASLEVSPRTVKTDWALCRSWLRRRLSPDAPSTEEGP